MASTKPAANADLPAWRAAGERYYSYSRFLRERFGRPVHKVSLDARFTCPNVDGSVTTGGCTFCDNRSFSPSRRLPRLSVLDQLAEGMRRVSHRYGVDQFIGYFQPATNTYAPVERLRPLFTEVVEQPGIVGLAIGTRPDCVPPDVIDLLDELGQRSYVSVEYGMQTMHEASLVAMNRGHGHEATRDAMRRSRGRAFETCLHIILGLPEETPEHWQATAREVAQLRPNGVKIHNLYAVHRTPLGDDVLAGRVQLLERDAYVQGLVDFLEVLPPDCVVERVGGEAPPDYLIGPTWALDKQALRRAIDAEFIRRNTWQGKHFP